jgi:tetratricopeptide (TPR) repeat protein
MGPLYKIRLASGRVLGPLDLKRIRALILGGQILGSELARPHPVGEWKEMGSFPELADMLLQNALGKLSGTPEPSSVQDPPAPVDLGAATQILAPTQIQVAPKPDKPEELEEPDEATVVGVAPVTSSRAASDLEPEEKTTLAPALEPEGEIEIEAGSDPATAVLEALPEVRNIANEKTVVFSRSSDSKSLPGRFGNATTRAARRVVSPIAVVLFGVYVLVEVLNGGSGSQLSSSKAARAARIRPVLPSGTTKTPDPAKSKTHYLAALAHYQQDTLPAYRKAVEGFHRALKADLDNVRALAFLASSYLNLIDVSNKDENYFSVILKLIELSRAKGVELPETLISDAEYLTFTGRPLAAQNRIIDYSKAQKNYSQVVLVYLAQALIARGEFAQAARYLASVPPKSGMDAKAYYLKGRVAEALGDFAGAVREYEATLKESPKHGFARYRMVKLANATNELPAVRKHLEFITSSAEHLPSRERADAFFIRSRLDQQEGKLDVALGHLERALRLEPENADYNLNYFLLRARAGDSLPGLKKEARVYFYMAESERLIREGKIEEAQIQLMEARREAPENPQPLVRLANLFYNNKADVLNARISLKKAAALAPSDVRIWSRYIELLIQSYEWDEANRGLARLRTLPVQQGAIDKAMADWYARQGRHEEAQQFYKKALSREVIEPSVYVAYGKSLLETKNYDQAPFIFALAQRMDPENPETIIGTAKAILGSEGMDRALAYLRDELQKGNTTRVELLCALAEMLIQKGAWDEAQTTIDQARLSAPDVALPYKVQAQLELAKPGLLRTGGELGMRRRAAQAYQSYLDRSPADAGILYERYKLLVELSEFKGADDALQRIYELYPRFPNLHYSKGLIYVKLGNFKAAQAEFEQELKNGNGSVQVLLALGGIHVELKEPEPALKYFVQAMQKAPREAEPKNQAAYANFLLKKYEASTALYREALKLDSGNPIIYRRLGDTYRAMSDLANARWAYQKYLEMEPDAADRDSLLRF